MGCVHLYCGEGKGKTTAAMGLAVRVAGSGGQAVIVRFLKTEDSGEVKALRQIPGITVIFCRESFGFTWQMTDEQKQEAAIFYQKLFEEAAAQALALSQKGPLPVLLVLDEICAALNHGLLSLPSVLAFLDGRPEEFEVVLTGRKPPEELIQRADYMTEMKKLCHPFDQGVAARRGIEY